MRFSFSNVSYSRCTILYFSRQRAREMGDIPTPSEGASTAPDFIPIERENRLVREHDEDRDSEHEDDG